MKWLNRAMWLVPVVLAAILWAFPPRGDDAYYHSVNAVEHVRAWQEGAVVPRYHRGWNGGTGSFAPTIYSPIPMAIQGAAAWAVGDGQRAVGVSLAAALLMTAAFAAIGSRKPEMALLVATPYLLAVVLARATTTEAWALAGAAAVLTLAMPVGTHGWRRGSALAAGVVLVAGSQIGMLVQLSWLLGAAWLAWIAVLHRRDAARKERGFRALVTTLCWGISGLLAAAWLWLPAVLDGRYLALGELVEGPFLWSENFLPSGTQLGVLLSATALCSGAVVVIVVLRGEGEDRWPLVAAAATALFLTVGLSAPFWRLPGMAHLQFPWRFLGPASVVLVLAATCVRGRWRWIAGGLLVLPSLVVPMKLDASSGGVPASASSEELARVVSDRWGLAPVLPSARGLYAPGFHRVASLQELAGQSARPMTQERSATGGSWRVSGSTGSSVMLPLQWWPEWTIEVGDREVPYANHSGLVAIELPEGEALVQARLRPSWSRAVGASVSLLGFLLLVGMVWRERRRA